MLFSTTGAGSQSANRMPVSTLLGSPPESGDKITVPTSQFQADEDLRDFGLITDTDGWILVGSRLYRTTNHGASWSEITPTLSSTATVYAANFLNAGLGWVLWSDFGADGNLVLQIECTNDGGMNWDQMLIRKLSSNDPTADIENASMDWLDANTGWVSVKQKSGVNFSSGTLFRTEDGGRTWVQLSLPIGEAVHFVNNRTGWVAGGPAGDQIYKTQDGGVNWEKQPVPDSSFGGQVYSLYPPVFDSQENGVIAVVMFNREEFGLVISSTGDGGRSWNPISNVPLGSQVGRPPLDLVDARNLVMSIPNSDRIIQMVNGEQKVMTNQDGKSAGIVDLEMLNSNFGWAKWNTGDCGRRATADGSSSVSCTSTSQLIETQDGGITWNSLAIPGNLSGSLTQQYQTTSTDLLQSESIHVGKTQLVIGQGFDICTIPTIAQLQTWWTSSPYKSVNLYIGGVARACPNPTLTAAYVSQMRQQGWSFIPTWVGPQAPCTTYIKRFSPDVSTAYADGVNEANLAAASLAALELTYPDMSGSVVYYDMENYIANSTQACRNAVNSFMDGWVTQLHSLGNLAGVYGSTLCNTGLSDFLTIPHIPDVIWPARWYLQAPYGTYNPAASVWDIGTCIPSSAWNNHQRIRQYAGDHTETWGGVPLYGIDSDVLDGVVAVRYFAVSNFYATPASGDPPLTVTFYIEKMEELTSCNWDYGDGQTGTSCDPSHIHTYVNNGRYTVSLFASGLSGSDHLIRSNYIFISPFRVHIPILIQK